MTTFKSWDDFAKTVNKAIVDAYKRASLKVLGDLAADIVRARTRKGYGVATPGGRKARLKRLSPTYIKQRRRNRRKLSPTTSPGKSNLTYSGQMLDELEPRAFFTRKQSFRLGFTSRKSRQKARWVAEQGRPFLNLSTSETNLIVEETENLLSKSFRARNL